MEGIVRAVCISDKRGTAKRNVQTVKLIKDYGIDKDAHAGHWHRQVSLLSYDKVEEFNNKGGNAAEGAFGENILVEGIDFKHLPVGTILKCKDVILRMTQIGKECHNHCEIYKRVGDCIMPREGVFAEVLSGGSISTGDHMYVELPAADTPLTAAVITLSDKGAAGLRKDTSGPKAAEILTLEGYHVVEQILLPDQKELIEKQLIRLCDSRQVNLILTTGGTGFSERDCTPEATMAVAERNVPGIAEAIRAGSMSITKRAMLSRGVSVIRKQTLIINLPGSEKAVEESLSFIISELEHGLNILRGTVSECGNHSKGV
ncbi:MULTISPECIES: MOSC domain-containing protein [Anaerostipes]|uniref:MOSC domain-containing protein n=1 Tax=Anaerostipes TaxID=207244 RepID=UPI00095181B3|nr:MULTISPECIES: MOSC domain-containing protein [Anaerostipes]MCI5623608.1 molybdopterin-binding protein [Anaerostipes sp.]MDY2725411.1 molybdopterin-binding protein [Anaerostipes faecalis]OLR58493.1 molybdenum cofactor biosynthesis protein [Anaerostipes sp. 494a]